MTVLKEFYSKVVTFWKCLIIYQARQIRDKDKQVFGLDGVDQMKLPFELLNSSLRQFLIQKSQLWFPR